MSEVWAAALVQFRVIAALMLRESRTRFGKSQIGYLWSLIEPIAVVATFTILFSSAGQPPPIGDSHAAFFLTGIVAYNGYRRTASFCSSALVANEALLTFPVVQQIDTLVARAVLELFTAILSMILIFVALHLVWDVSLPADVGRMAVAMFVLSLLGFGHGAITAIIGTYIESWPRLDEMLSRPLFFVSGVFFISASLPPAYLSILEWNPLLHGIELMRSGYYSHYRSDVIDIGYLLIFTSVLVLVALAAERVMRLRPERDN